MSELYEDQHEEDGVEGVEDEIDDEIAGGVWAEEMPLSAERGVKDGIVFKRLRTEPRADEAIGLMYQGVFEQGGIVVPQETSREGGEISEEDGKKEDKGS